jgi:hypothetical protein
MPPVIFPLVRKIVEEGLVPVGEDLVRIIKFSSGVYTLIRIDSVLFPQSSEKGPTGGNHHPQVSDELRYLLKTSLALAEVALLCKAPVVRNDIGEPHTLTSKPYQPSNPQASAFEVMVRTGSWFPGHPVIRTLPSFLPDYLAGMSRTSKSVQEKAAKRMAELQEATTKHIERINMEGKLCTKHPTSFRALTPGIFAIFCAKCRFCLGFEMMSHAESTLIPFRIFCHRMWRREDVMMWENYKENGVWKDWLYPSRSESSQNDGDCQCD